MLAETYGTLPHKVLQAEELLPMDRFTLDVDVMEATAKAKESMKGSTDPTKPGSATKGQFSQMASDQEGRARQREAIESGASASPNDQIAGLNHLRQRTASGQEAPERNDSTNGNVRSQ